MKKTIKYFSYLFISLTTIIILSFLTLQTQFSKNILRDKIVKEINSSIYAQLKIGKIEGNFYNNLILKNVVIHDENETIISASSIALYYQPWNLLDKEIYLSKLAVDTLNCNLVQNEDFSWNIEKILSGTPSKIAKKDTFFFPFDWNLIVKMMKISASSLHFYAKDTLSLVPQSITDFNMNLSATIDSDSSKIILNECRFLAHNPDLKIDSVKALMILSKNGLAIKAGKIKTGKNLFSLNASYNPNQSDIYKIFLNVQHLDLIEFSDFFHYQVAPIHPDVKVTVLYNKDILKIEGTASLNEQWIFVDGIIKNSTENPDYFVKIKFQKINLTPFIEKAPHTAINGKFSIKGKGIKPWQSRVELNGQIFNSDISERHLDSLTLQLTQNKNQLRGIADFSGNFGKVNSRIQLKKFDNNLQFEISGIIKHFNLSPVLHDNTFESDLNMNFNASGKSVSYTPLFTKVNLLASTSIFRSYQIDSLCASLLLKNKTAFIDSLTIGYPGIKFKLNGILSMEQNSNLFYSAKINNLDSLKPLHLENIDGSGNIYGTLNGNTDSLFANLQYDLRDIRYNSYRASAFTGKINFIKLRDEYQTNQQSKMQNIELFKNQIDSLNLSTQQSGKNLANNISLFINDSTKASIQANAVIDSNILISIPHLSFNKGDEIWINNDSINFNIQDKTFALSDFNISSGNQLIKINGTLKNSTLENVNLKIEHLDLKNSFHYIYPNLSIAGEANIAAKISGTISSPLIESTISIKNLSYSSYKVNELDGNFVMTANKISWLINANNPEKNPINVSGYFSYRFDEDGFILKNKPLSLKLNIDNFVLKPINELNKGDTRIEGIINSDLSLENTFSSPRWNGSIDLTNGSILNNVNGIDYKDIQIQLIGAEEKLVIEKFAITQPKGSLKFSGYLGNSVNKINHIIEPLEISVSANNFKVISSEKYELQLNGKMKISNLNSKAEFDGTFLIPRSGYYVPNLLTSNYGKKIDLSTPLLLRASVEKSTIKITENRRGLPDLAKVSFAKKFNGKVTFEIPGNLWLKGPNINLELYGKVTVIKNNEQLLFYDNLNINKGFYLYLGKKFVVKKGQITFNGSPQFNPSIFIEVEYKFYDNFKIARKIQIIISNNILKPDIQFTLDKNPISGGDAVSYILFGKRMTDLSQTQQVGINSGNFAANLTASFLSAKLTNTLGESLGLDVINISSNENLTKASFAAGKYITNNIFLQYEKGFGKDDDGTINPQVMTLGYQLTRFFYLHLIESTNNSTGIDLILKID